MALIRQNRHRARLFVLLTLCLFLAALVSRASENAQATSGGSSYDIPVVTDTNPAANVVETTITADETTIDIGNGVTAHAQTFNGAIPGPTFQLNVGDTVIVHFKNDMATVTGIHWHGIELENNMDGTPFTQDQVAPGDSFLYKFKVSRPGIFWYHPHHHSSTNQVFKGLYGMILIKDPNEAVLPAGTLPSAANTKPLVLSDTTVCKAQGSNDADMYDVTPPTAPWVNGPDLPAQSPPTPPVALCETSPVNEDETAGPPFNDHDIPNIQQSGASRTNEGQTVLTNGKNVGGRAGSPHSFGPPIGALDPGAQTLDVQAGQGLRLPLLNASAIRYFRLRLTDDTGAMIPLVRIGGEGGLLDHAVIEGNTLPVPAGTFDTGYEHGEIVLPPGSRADVVTAIPVSATGVLTLWEEDYSRTGQGFSNIPTVPVMHLNVNGTASSTYTIGDGTPLASLGTPVPIIGSPTGSILDPASFSPTKLGNASPNITLIATGGGVNVDGVVGTHDVSPPYTGADHLGSTRYAKLGDTLQLSVTNQSGAHHPFHLHGFSMQPISLTPDATHPTDPSFTWPYSEFRDNIDVPGHDVLTFRIKLEDRTLADGVTLGGGLGRWVFHCHIFFHATLGMLSEVVVTDANGNEAPDVDANDPVVEVASSGDTATMDGTFADRDSDPVTLTASVGTVTTPGAPGTWHWENDVTTCDFVYITATDSNGHKDQAVFQEQLADCPPVVSADDATGEEGSPIPIHGTVSKPSTNTWSFVAGAGVDAGATCAIADASALDTTINCTDDGTYTLTLSADDGVNPPVEANATLTVTNADPSVSISSPAAGTLFELGVDTTSVTAPFTDAGSNDTHTCSIDWGDSAVTAGVVAEAAGSGTCTGSHMYTVGGHYAIVVTVTDDDSGDGSASVAIVAARIIRIGPSGMGGDLRLAPGTILVAGYSFTMPGQHPLAIVEFIQPHADFLWTCVSGPGTGGFTVSMPDQSYVDPANSSSWYPSGDQHSPLVRQGSLPVPNVCGGGLVRVQRGTFISGILSTDLIHKVNVRWHYGVSPGYGGWSATGSIIPG